MSIDSNHALTRIGMSCERGRIHLMTVAKHVPLRSVGEQPIQLEAGVTLRNEHDFIPNDHGTRDQACR
jgi:hypothetical protein